MRRHGLSTDRFRDVLTVEKHRAGFRVIANLNRQISCRLNDGIAIERIYLSAQHGERGYSIHRAGIQVFSVQAFRERAAGGRFSGSGRSVDGNK